VDGKRSQDVGETNGSEGEAAGSESRRAKRLEVRSRPEIFVRHIKSISNEIRIARSQKLGSSCSPVFVFIVLTSWA